MIRCRLASIFALLVLCALSRPAIADIPDPHVIINDFGGSGPIGCSDLTGFGIDFTTNGMGNALVCFTNKTGVDFFQLEFILKYPIVMNQLMCGGNAFSTCEVQFDEGFTTLDFTGGIIANGASFTIDVEGFKPNAAFHGDANQDEPEPEPATLVLLGSGLAATGLKGWKKIS